jgi:elongation factor P
MATTTDITKGLCIEFNGQIFSIVEFQHVKPGKGPAFVRTKLKNLKTGRVIDNTFASGAKIDIASVERRSYQYLYKDEMGFNFMHVETFDQISIPEEMIETPLLLKEGIKVDIAFDAATETPLACDLPSFVVLEVVYTEPGLKGDTSSATAMKPAKLETGIEVRVPLFVEQGDLIKVDTRNNSYAERVKK